MPDSSPRLNRILLYGIAILGLQGLLTLAYSRSEYFPSPPALTEFPWSISSWEGVSDTELDSAALQKLSPDDLLNRDYIDTSRGSRLNLFIAYYKTQHKAGGAHDPKVCLPGTGWNPLASRVVQVHVPESNVSFPANYYVIAKDSDQAVVLYWYQSVSRIVAEQHVLRLDRIIDTIETHRTDMALVRIVVPANGNDLDTAGRDATLFAVAIYPYMQRQFPAKISNN